jgi:hypothetical protein
MKIDKFLNERTAPHGIEVSAVKPKHKLLDMVVGVNDLYAAYGSKDIGRNEFSRQVEQLGAIRINEKIKVSGEVVRAYGFYLKLLPNGVEDLLDERERTHGSFKENALTAQNIKAAMRHSPNWHKLPQDYKEGLEMVATKLGRLLSGDWQEPDHLRDVVGYLTLLLR